MQENKIVNDEIDIPKYIKKKKSNTSKSKSKSKHKHEYVECLFIVTNLFGKLKPCPGTYYKLCGKIDHVNTFCAEKIEGVYHSLSDEEIYEKYKHLNKVYIDDIFQKYAPLSHDEEK